jgi:hypothetical protein
MEEDLKLFLEKEIMPYMTDLMWVLIGILLLIVLNAQMTLIRFAGTGKN